jgi:hypothetical protein
MTIFEYMKKSGQQILKRKHNEKALEKQFPPATHKGSPRHPIRNQQVDDPRFLSRAERERRALSHS